MRRVLADLPGDMPIIVEDSKMGWMENTALYLAAAHIDPSPGSRRRAPLALVPENTMKFVVGVILTSFGVFWGAEGASAQWPGADAALLAVVPAVALFAAALVAVLRRIVRRAPPRSTQRVLS
jgi:hypothetical protein